METHAFKRRICIFLAALLCVMFFSFPLSAIAAEPAGFPASSDVTEPAELPEENTEENPEPVLPEAPPEPKPPAPAGTEGETVLPDAADAEEEPVEEEEGEEEEETPLLPAEELVILGGQVFTGDDYYSLENLPHSAIVLREYEQVTAEYTISVVDAGGYDVNQPGSYTVTFEAVHKDTPEAPPLTGSGTFNVVSPAGHFRTSRMMRSGYYTGDDFNIPTPDGYPLKAQACGFFGYHNAQAVPTTGDIMLFSGTPSNYFWYYTLWTDKNVEVPIYCVEPNVQDREPNGGWVGHLGRVYQPVSSDSGDTGTFHDTPGSWALATQQQRTIASAAAYFSRPEALFSSSINSSTSEMFYVVTQVLVWECLTGVIETNPSFANFLEPKNDVSYYHRYNGTWNTGRYSDYEYSLYQCVILGNNYPEYGFPTLDAYNAVKQRMKDHYAMPKFMYPTQAMASTQGAALELPAPGAGGLKLSATASVLASYDWSAILADNRSAIDTSTVSQGYITVYAQQEIDKSSPAVMGYTKARTKNSQKTALFISPYGNLLPTGQTKMFSQTLDPYNGYMSFYTADAPQGQLLIQKKDSQTQALITEPATFSIYSAEDIVINGQVKWPSGTLIETLTTGTAAKDRDKNGNPTQTLVNAADNGTKLGSGIAISSHLPPGKYRIVETSPPAGYVGNWTADASITKEKPFLTFTANNQKQKVEVLKVDEDYIQKHLEGAEFDLFEQQPDNSWKLVDQLTTGKDGKAVSDKIKNGRYKMVETKAPEGYTSGWEEEFTVTASDTLIQLTATDKKQKVEVLKVDEDYIEKHLEGAEFDLFELQPDNSWKLVDQLTTGKDGKAVSDKIKNGRYKMVETKAPEGYTSGWEEEFTVTASDTLVQLTATDKKQKVEVLKVDEENPAKHLPGAAFDLFELQPDNSWTLVDQLTTGEDGRAVSDKIKNGRYKLVETKAPAEYVADWETEFDVTADDALVQLTATNKYISGTVLIHKIDASDGAKLPGVVFEIKDKDNNVVATAITGENGTAEIPLPYGQYFITETKGLPNYVLCRDTFEVNITQDGMIIPLTVKNDRIYGRLEMKLPRKPFPATGIGSEITREYEFTTDENEPSGYDAPETVTENGKEYRLVEVAYTLQSEPMQQTVTLENLSAPQVPKTHLVEDNGQNITLSLVDVSYTEQSDTEPVQEVVTLGYFRTKPTAPQTRSYTPENSEGECALTLEDIRISENHTWRNFEVDAVFYGSRDVHGFMLGDAMLPYREEKPVWEGYETTILNYLSLDGTSYRIVDASWTDPDFVSDGEASIRRAKFICQEYTALWEAVYTGEAETTPVYTATAHYATESSLYLFTATATYALAEPSGITLKTVVIIVGVLLLVCLMVFILFTLSKKRKLKKEQEEFPAEDY